MGKPAATDRPCLTPLSHSFTLGIILVLSAKHTRRVTALKIKNALRQVRLLGTVLSDREFPIPTSIYRRL
jgi:hypothetical protein